MGPSPSWTLLLNLRLMVLCPYLYTGNPHIQTSIYSGTATITSLPSLVSSKPSPTGLPPCAVILSCFKKKRSTSGKLSPNANYPKWALDKVEKRLNKSPRQVNDRGNQNAQSANQGVPSKGHIVIPYTQGLCESIKKICGRYGHPNSLQRWLNYQKPTGLPQGTKTLWSTKVVPSIGTNVVT